MADPVQPAPTATNLATPQNIEDLARVLMSEASVGNAEERQAVGFTVLNRMNRNANTAVRQVWGAYAHGQAPTKEMTDLAEDLLQGHLADTTGGATHYYSPRSMPNENASAEALVNVDTAGGLESIEGLPRRTYRPGWSLNYDAVTIPGVRATRYRFHRAPGTGHVR